MLTELQARKAQPRDKDYKLSDASGLFLYVTTNGARSWRFKYRFAGRDKQVVFGPYPDIGLAEARDLRDAARKQVREHQDPAVEKRRRRIAAAAAAIETFEKLARAWHALQAPRWAPVHADDVLSSLERDIFPALGKLPIPAVDGRVILVTLRKVEARGSIETARRLRQRIAAIFDYAISEGVADRNPAAAIVKALKPLPRKGRQPALTDIDELRSVLLLAEASEATPVAKLASRLLALTATRPGVIRGVTWDEFQHIDWDDTGVAGKARPIWRVPSARMKLILDRKDREAFDHVVPLSAQAIDVLRATRLMTGRNKLVFPSVRHSHRPMSENTIGYLYNRVGFHGRHVPHGWRAAFSTVMNEKAVDERRPMDRAVIDLMLAHVPKDKIESAYNRAAYMERRHELAQEWADLLCEGLASSFTLIEGKRR